MVLEFLEQFMRYCVEWEMEEKQSYVNGSVMHFARPDAWTGSVISTL